VSHRIVLSLLCASLLFVNTASAQNWSFDARKIGIGSPTGGENMASRMIEEEGPYRAIALPFGLIQVFRDFDRLNPSKDARRCRVWQFGQHRAQAESGDCGVAALQSISQ
jgi:hypothetical protein